MPKPKVVFVCEHGAVKSVIAREHFLRLARARGHDIDAVARGTDPDPEIPASVLDGLGEDGFDVAQAPPRRFGKDDLDATLLVVSFDADVSPIVGDSMRHEEWNGLPPAKTDYANGKIPILALVEKLVDRLDNLTVAG